MFGFSRPQATAFLVMLAMIAAAPPERGGVRVAVDVDPHSFL